MKTKPIIAALFAAVMVTGCPLPVRATQEPRAAAETQTDYVLKAGRAMKTKWKHGRVKIKAHRVAWHGRLRVKEWR